MDDARERLLQAIEAYRPALADVSAMYPTPPSVTVRETPDGDGPEGSRVTALAWESAYRPFLGEYRAEHERFRENLTAHARLYTKQPGATPRPVMVCLHGWGGGVFWFEERAFAVPYWLRRGYDVALFQLPYHGARAPAEAPRGAVFPSAHVVRTNEAFGQAVFDLRTLRAHLGRKGGKVGAIGMSLGGYTTALWATVDPELAWAVPMIPAIDFADLMWRHGEDSPARKRATAAGVDADLLREVFAVTMPETRAPLVPFAARMVVGGEGDRITPPEHAERLWRHWGECAIHWFPGGHLAQIGRGDAFRAVRRHLDPLHA
jgi:pimeloyl-ACP methyl ester carboxylesterase